VVCVHASDETRIARTMHRDKCSREQAEKLLRSQMPQDEKMRRADLLIENEGSEQELVAAAGQALKELVGRLGKK
jgi:dephospho-CoA kinase